jgi:hypothetical protein
MAYDDGLAERLRNVLMDTPNIGERKMFGGLAFMLNDYMFVGIIGENLMARVGPEQYESALNKPSVTQMDFTGKPMKGYVYVLPAGIAEDDDLTYWVDLCASFVKTLPPKEPKPGK